MKFWPTIYPKLFSIHMHQLLIYHKYRKNTYQSVQNPHFIHYFATESQSLSCHQRNRNRNVIHTLISPILPFFFRYNFPPYRHTLELRPGRISKMTIIYNETTLSEKGMILSIIKYVVCVSESPRIGSICTTYKLPSCVR